MDRLIEFWLLQVQNLGCNATTKIKQVDRSIEFQSSQVQNHGHNVTIDFFFKKIKIKINEWTSQSNFGHQQSKTLVTIQQLIFF